MNLRKGADMESLKANQGQIWLDDHLGGSAFGAAQKREEIGEIWFLGSSTVDMLVDGYDMPQLRNICLGSEFDDQLRRTCK